MNNPYIAPTADMTMPESDLGTYEPRIFALSGRIGRLRYIAYGMLLALIAMLPYVLYIAKLAFSRTQPASMQYVMLLPLYLVIVLLATRRLIDIGHSRWWSVLMLIPVVSVIPYFYLLFKGGDEQANDYGPPPCANSRGVVVVVWLAVVMMILSVVAALRCQAI